MSRSTSLLGPNYRRKQYKRINLIIDSRDSYGPSTEFSYNFKFPTLLREVQSISVRSVSVFNTFDNIYADSATGVADGNNIFQTQLGEVTIPVGHYSAAGLVTAINAGIGALPGVLGATPWVSLPDPTLPGIDWNLQGILIGTAGSTMSDVLGLILPVTGLAGVVSTKLFMGAPLGIRFHCPKLEFKNQTYLSSPAAGINSFVSVPIIAGYNTINFHQPPYPVTLDSYGATDLQELQLNVYDGGSNRPISELVPFQISLDITAVEF